MLLAEYIGVYQTYGLAVTKQRIASVELNETEVKKT